MMFLRSLRELQKAKSLAKIDFDDGDSTIGFIVYADEETFDLYKLDNVYNDKILDEDSDGGITLESEEDVKGLDFIFTKASYITNNIHSIVYDISHKFPVDKTYFFGTTAGEIYKSHDRVQATLNGNKTKKKLIIVNFPSSIKTETFEIKPRNNTGKGEN